MVPKLRFKDDDGKEFPRWEEFIFGNIFGFKPTNALSRENLNYIQGNVKNIHYGDIHTKFRSLFDITREMVPYINFSVPFLIKEDILCRVGDVILVDASEDYNDIGKAIEIVHLNGETLVSGLHTFLARPKEGFLALGFITYYMKSYPFRLQLMTIAQGTKVLSISIGRLSNITLKLPSIQEQTKIAGFLSAIDDKIAQLTKQHTLLNQYKKGIMQKIFSQELRFKDDDGKEFSGWKEVKLGDVATFFSGGTPSTTNSSYYNGNIKFIKSGEISAASTQQTITELGLSNSSAKMVFRGDLLYALYGATSGEVSISKLEGAINQAVLCIRSKRLNSHFLYSYLLFKKQLIIETYLQGGQGNLSAEIVKSFLVPQLSKKEQTKIANFLSAIDDKIQQKQSELDAVKEYKRGLLQQVFI